MKHIIALSLTFVLALPAQERTAALKDGSNVTGQSTWKTKLSFLQAADVSGIYAPLNSPTFTGTVSGVTKSMVGLGNVDNTSDASKASSGPIKTALDTKISASALSTGTITPKTGDLDFGKLQKSSPYLTGNNGGMRAFRSHCARGETAAALFISDSTGKATGGWIEKFADALVTRYPSARVLYRRINSGATVTTTEMQAGSERQHWLYGTTVTTMGAFCSNSNFRAQIGGRYLGIEVEMAPTADAALTSGYPTAGMELGGYGSGSVMGWLGMSSSGRLELYWYDEAGFKSALSTSGQPVPALVVGTYVRYRALLDAGVEGGASRTVQFHRSSDNGNTWTQVGSTITASAAASPNVAATTGQSASLGKCNQNAKIGYKYSHMQIMRDALYEPILPERIDAFALVAGAISNVPVLGGSPTIFLDVVAADGAGIDSGSYFGATLPTHAWSLLRDRWHDFVLINSSHNDAWITGSRLAVRTDALRTLVQSRLPSGITSNFIHSTQNPETTDYYPGLAAQHNSRQAEIVSYAARKASPSIDIYQAFLDDGRAVEDVLVSGTDGVHPTAAGYQVWADAFWNSCFLDGTNE